MDKEKKKAFRLPAQGKPKPKPLKSSIKAMGTRAAKEYMANDGKSKLTTDKSLVKADAYITSFTTSEFLKKASPKSRRGAYIAARAQSRRTGV